MQLPRTFEATVNKVIGSQAHTQSMGSSGSTIWAIGAERQHDARPCPSSRCTRGMDGPLT